MKYHTDPDHPNVHDNAQGTAVFWSEGHPDNVEVLIWNSYSSGDGEYNATNVRFSVDEENKNLVLEWVKTKNKFSMWDEGLTNPARYVSDRMKRVARSFIAQQTKTDYWRVQLFKE